MNKISLGLITSLSLILFTTGVAQAANLTKVSTATSQASTLTAGKINETTAAVSATASGSETQKRNGPPTGVEAPGQLKQSQVENQERVKNVGELQQLIKENEVQLTEQTAQISDQTEKKVLQKQNAVREAVHTLLASEDLLGGIGQQVSAIAREFSNSVPKTVAQEIKLEKRGWWAETLWGGDQKTAKSLLQEVQQNYQHLQQLSKLQEQCSNCSVEVKTILQQQLSNLMQEQQRLQQRAQAELVKSGLFGWLFRLLQ